MKLQEFVVQSSELVNELSEAIENQQIGLKEVEERILVFVNKIGDLMVQKVVEKVGDPLTENRVWVEEQEAVFDQVRNMRFRNRFGGVTERTRRCYKSSCAKTRPDLCMCFQQRHLPVEFETIRQDAIPTLDRTNSRTSTVSFWYIPCHARLSTPCHPSCIRLDQ